MRWRLALLGVAALLGGCSNGPRDVEAHARWLEPHIRIVMPQGVEGPVPAVLMFSGCGGVISVQDDYAAIANEAGTAALIVDSHSARGIGRLGARLLVCSGLRMRGDRRAGDVIAAMEIARDHPGIDASHLTLIGWSHGGWTLMDVLTRAADGMAPPGLDAMPEDALAGVETVMLVYPWCGVLNRARRHSLASGLPVRALLAGEDVIADPQDCTEIFERESADGADLEWQVLAGLTHAFDAPDEPLDPRVRHDEEGTQLAHDWFAAGLRRRDDAPSP
ncbi:MAG: dienelactone hydrolase family protein [Caulobacterales bacterium]|uniref:dienelactone hydrolase family protein n=1 Tax=Glycocaulis sp. TaxID=1969725 RepID=UPI003F9F2D4F